MVEDPGKAPGTGTYQPVNLPSPATVEEDARGLPKAVVARRRQVIIAIEDRWRIDDEWWRKEPIGRMYYSVRLASGQKLVLFKDTVNGGWYSQSC